jgi:hypothetical protein
MAAVASSAEHAEYETLAVHVGSTRPEANLPDLERKVGDSVQHRHVVIGSMDRALTS